MKHFNYGYLLEQEKKVTKLFISDFDKPLKILDESTSYFMKLLRFVYKLHESTRKKELRNYCKYFLTTGNAVIHMVRTTRYAVMTGYYGNVMVLMRSLINYLNMSIYIHHHPEDAELLLKESRESFKTNKDYKKKFHEYNLKKELENIGYKIPEQFDDVAKSTHGSLWGAQAFGFKGLKTPENEYELQYSPLYSLLQSTTYLSMIMAIPTDFSMYCLKHLHDNKIDIDKKIIEEFRLTDKKVRLALLIMEEEYQFIKNTPIEIRDALQNKVDKAIKENGKD